MKKSLSMLALAVLTIGLLGSCTRIDNLEKRIDSLENDKIASIDDQIASIQSSIKKLDQIDGLSKRADELEAFVKKDLPSKSWVDATYASLEQFQITCDTVAKLKEKLGQTDEKIDECVESLKDWINSEFNDYYKIAEIDAKLKAFKDTTLAEEIAKTKEELTEGYKAAVKAAIEDNDGFVTPEIKNALGTLNGKVDVLNSKVNSIEEEISQIKSMIQSIAFEPAYTGADVGKYFGDIDTTDLFLDLTLNYRIKPAAALDSIFASGDDVDSFFSLYYRRVNVPVQDPETRASYVENPKLNVKSLTRSAIDSELVTILIGRDEFNRLPVRNYISDHTSLSVALGVKAGKTDMISDYTTVNFEEVDFSEERENLYKQMAILVGSRQPGKDYNAYRVLFNMCGDDVIAAGRDHDEIAALNQFRHTANNPVIYECYTNLYKAIDVCNQFIYKYFNPQKDYRIRDSRIPAGSTDPSRRCLAEARVLRAWLHFTLATGWGNPPLDTISPALPNPKNCDQKDVFKWCIEELTACINSGSLVSKSNINDTEAICVVSKQFAQALAGKVCLFLNNPQEAVSLLGAVISSGRYDLVPISDFPNHFRSVGNRNVEKIFELDMEKYSGPGYVDDSLLPYMGMETSLWNWYSNGFVADPMARVSSIKGKGGLGVPQSFARNFIDYEQNNGASNYPRAKHTLKNVRTAIVDSPDYGSSEINAMSPDDRAKSDKVGIKAEGLYGQSFYFLNKTLALNEDLNPWNGNRRTNFTAMRYAEVLLLAAEAYSKTGDQAKATECYNKIRKRSDEFPKGTATLDNIIDEKHYELWMEGCRWTDLVRWSDQNVIKIEDLLGKAGKTYTVLYDKLTRLPKEAETSAISWENGSEGNSRFYTVDYPNPKADLCGFKKGKHELFPFPAAVVRANPNLKQNQGW